MGLLGDLSRVASEGGQAAVKVLIVLALCILHKQLTCFSLIPPAHLFTAVSCILYWGQVSAS